MKLTQMMKLRIMEMNRNICTSSREGQESRRGHEHASWVAAIPGRRKNGVSTGTALASAPSILGTKIVQRQQDGLLLLSIRLRVRDVLHIRSSLAGGPQVIPEIQAHQPTVRPDHIPLRVLNAINGPNLLALSILIRSGRDRDVVIQLPRSRHCQTIA